MITIENYELFVDKRTSKNNKEYYALYIRVGDKEEFVNYIHKSIYEYIVSLSK